MASLTCPMQSQKLTLETHPGDPEARPIPTTRAPTDTWRPLVDWASAAGCLMSSACSHSFASAQQNPEWLGTVLHTMSTSRARKLLVDWAACLPELEPLYTLAYEVSATSSPAIPAALPASVPPERQLRGSLSTAFIDRVTDRSCPACAR
jgi:hypothetical protein